MFDELFLGKNIDNAWNVRMKGSHPYNNLVSDPDDDILLTT